MTKKTAVILMNLGTPSAPTVVAIRRYLREFLSDKRVVEIPRLIWYPILYGIILPFRPKRTAAAYQQLWHEYGDSPLRVISAQQLQALSTFWRERNGDDVQFRLAMTYGEPALASVVDELQAQNVEQILLLPLYPQFSATTTGAIYDQVAALFQARRNIPAVNVIKQYFDHPLYIAALAQSVRAHWKQSGRAQRLLMSFHGIPRRNVDLGDPYRAQCEATAQSLAAALGLEAHEWSLSFQSRLGRAEWLQPYTSVVMRELGEAKTASIDVICPAFATDCLETLEEIAIENREIFQRAGGGEFRYIPCLNADAAHIEFLSQLVAEHLPR
ncbi:MAG: ferrochelatase [Spongiibacteraceae bacterium]